MALAIPAKELRSACSAEPALMTWRLDNRSSNEPVRGIWVITGGPAALKS